MMNQIDKSALFVKNMKACIHFTPHMSFLEISRPDRHESLTLYIKIIIQDFFNHDPFGVER